MTHNGQIGTWFALIWGGAGLLDPVRTRDALAIGLTAASNAPVAPPRFGVFRM